MSVPELSANDLKLILDFTVNLACKAGELIIQGSEAIQLAGSTVDEKKHSFDLVTEYDVRVEELVKKEISDTYPDFKSIGKESYAMGSRSPLTDDRHFAWILLYTGITGQGSYLSRHGRRADATSSRKIAKTSPYPEPCAHCSCRLLSVNVAVEWGNDRTIDPLTKRSESLHKLAGDPDNGVQGGRMAHSLRSLGSSALNFAMVAQGGLDIYWEIGCWPWDVCAGMVIAQEAGGIVTGSHEYYGKAKDSPSFGEPNEEILTGRKYLVVRAVGDSETEKGRDAQKRIMGEFYSTTVDYNVS